LPANFAASSIAFGRRSAAGNTALTEPDAKCFGRVDRIAAQQHLHGLRPTDKTRKALAPRETGNDAEVDLGLTERRVFRREAKVASHRQFAPASEREAVHGGDDGERGVFEEIEGRLSEARELAQFDRGHFLHRGDIGPGLTNDGFFPVSAPVTTIAPIEGSATGRGHRRADVDQRRAIERIELGRTVDDERADGTRSVDENVLVSHLPFSLVGFTSEGRDAGISDATMRAGSIPEAATRRRA
jgi:hypothetical protein